MSALPFVSPTRRPLAAPPRAGVTGPLRATRRLIGWLMCAMLASPAMAQESSRHGHGHGADASRPQARPLVIGHRGASGYVPEHTLAAYWLAIEQGADFVEPDLVITKDGVLVARHENAIAVLNADGTVREATTDVVDHPEFASRKTTKVIDGTPITGWFTEDFTLAELKTLRARERLPQLRPANTRFDNQFEIPTFEEVLQLVARANESRREEARAARRGHDAWRPVGVYPETKHPTYFQGIGKPLEPPLVQVLHRHGYRTKGSPVIVQSFETQNLRRLARMTRVPLALLLNGSGRPYDFVVSGDPRTYADLARPEGLAEIATYADGVGANTQLLIPLSGGRLGTPTTLVADAHRAGLIVHAWTFRAENNFLPDEFDRGTDPAGLGDLTGHIHAFLKLGIDGFFTDQPFLGRQAVDRWTVRP